jgi:hypothetical protein
MNLHPQVLSQAAFLEKPRSRKKLYRLVSLNEEKFSVLKERGRLGPELSRGGRNGSGGEGRHREDRDKSRAPVRGWLCWGCGQHGHVRSWGPWAALLSTFHNVTPVSVDAPLWLKLRLKAGKVPALADTRAQFSCMRSDVAEFLCFTGEPCVFSPCSVCCVLADGTRGEVTNAVRLHVKVLDFAWDHEFKVLNGGPSPLSWALTFCAEP